MTELKLYNTLTRQKEVFVPDDPNNVRMYVCGPTVYDFAHIGNARPVIVFDVLFRLLRHIYGEDKVTYVRNITDVDDKINARALRDYPDLPLNEAIRNVTEKTANQFHADVKALGCLEPTHEPRATEFVLPREDGKSDMQSLIQTLLDKNHAYIAEGAQGKEVLFRIGSMEQYGALSNRIGKLNEQVEGARVAVESHKENAGDFVLWKESNAEEPGWAGIFNGETIHGRPGWHIECSAMSAAYLGETFDIHGGGLDLIFPHHENEIAQSCCAHGTDKMANLWMHNGYLQVEGKKMSKSDGNFVTIHDLLHTDKFGGRKWPGEVLRLAMLMTHYREPIDFSVKRLEEAEKILLSLGRIRRRVSDRNPNLVNEILANPNMPSPIVASLQQEMNAGNAIKAIQGMAKASNDGNEVAEVELLNAAASMGFELADGAIQTHAEELVFGESISQRLDILKRADSLEQGSEKFQLFEEADRIRDELAAQGIQLKDSKDSETGERVTTWEVKR